VIYVSVHEKIARILMEKGVSVKEATITYSEGDLRIRLGDKEISLSPFDNLVLTIMSLHYLRDVLSDALDNIENENSKTTINNAIKTIDTLLSHIPRIHEILEEEW